MQRYLNTACLIDRPEVDRILSWGWQGVRVETPVDLRNALRAAPADPALCAQAQDLYRLFQERYAGLGLVYIIEQAEARLVPDEFVVEYLDEPDIGTWRRLSAPQYRAELAAVLPGLLDRGCTVYAGSVANCSGDNLAYLKSVMAGQPRELRAAVHRYPLDDSQDRTKPRKPYKNRRAERDAVFAAACGHPVALTEFGLQRGRYRCWTVGKYFLKTLTRSDEWVADQLRQEFAFWAEAEIDCACLYRYQSGHGDFGVIGDDGRPKPQATVPGL